MNSLGRSYEKWRKKNKQNQKNQKDQQNQKDQENQKIKTVSPVNRNKKIAPMIRKQVKVNKIRRNKISLIRKKIESSRRVVKKIVRLMANLKKILKIRRLKRRMKRRMNKKKIRVIISKTMNRILKI